MVKVGVIGATGGVGALFCKAALAHGHEVSILVRSSEKAHSIFGEVVDQFKDIVLGDCTDAEAVRRLATDVEVLICLVAMPLCQPSDEGGILSKTASNLLAATRSGQRLFFCSRLGIARSSRSYRIQLKLDSGKRNVKDYDRADALLMEAIGMDGVSITVLRPAALVDNGATGKYLAKEEGGGAMKKLARRDLSQFLIDHLADSKWTDKAVHIYRRHVDMWIY